ncbi:MAG: TIGR04283 family arsenosugar biosynthesis glycosyltransferase [Flavobacteriaceae bacterium]
MLSLVVPVWNERERLPQFLKQFQPSEDYEILIVDGGSTDGSWQYLTTRAEVRALQTQKGRARQMNYGAAHAKGQSLFFLHVDSQLPTDWWEQLSMLFGQQETIACFRLRFDVAHPLLWFAAYGSRWSSLLYRGGDQGLFVLKSDFQKVGGFNTHYRVCEDLEILRQLLSYCKLRVLSGSITTSARHFLRYGIGYTHLHFRILHLLHYWKVPPKTLYRYYEKRFQPLPTIPNQIIRSEKGQPKKAAE